MKYKDKTVLITGASSGIGYQTAIEFAKRGANLILVARRETRLNQLAEKLKQYNIKCLAYTCDISKKDQVLEMSKIVLETFGTVDILVNNAGFAIYGSASDLSIDDIESQMATNYLGMIYCTKTFLPSMLEQDSGHIVNVASLAASFGLPGIAPYCASKFAMLGFSEGLKHELSGKGVDITVVSPIMVKTEFFDHESFTSMPKSNISLDAKTVAKAIVRAADSSRLEIVVPSISRTVVWLKHTVPFIINPILGRMFSSKLRSTHSSSTDSDSISSSSSDFNSN